MTPEEDAWAKGPRHLRDMPPSMGTKLAGNTAEAWQMSVFGDKFRFGNVFDSDYHWGELGRAFFV